MNSQEINQWFNEYVEGWMFSDIQRAIDSGCNYLATLGIAVYSEALIRLIYPDLGSGKRYGIFVRDYLGEEYGKVDDMMGTIQVNAPNRKPEPGSIYNIVRCGLAHEFWIKFDGYIFQKSASGVSCGIIFDAKEKKTTIILDQYFTDFKNAAYKIRQDLLTKSATLGFVIVGDTPVGHSGVYYILRSGPIDPSQVDKKE